MNSGVSIIDARIPESADGWRLDRALADAVPTLSRERLKALIASGNVTCPDGLARDPSRKTQAGTLFAVTVPDPVADPQRVPVADRLVDGHRVVAVDHGQQDRLPVGVGQLRGLRYRRACRDARPRA